MMSELLILVFGFAPQFGASFSHPRLLQSDSDGHQLLDADKVVFCFYYFSAE